MIRNNESWDLGEPELDDRGRPVLHDIASRLDGIRPSPDLPVAFPEGTEDFTKLQAQFRLAQADMSAEDTRRRKLSGSSSSSPSLAYTEKASSTESDHSAPYKYQNETGVQQRRRTGAKAHPSASITSSMKPTPLIIQRNVIEDDGTYWGASSPQEYLDTPSSTSSRTSHFLSWSTSDKFLGARQPLDLPAQLMRARQFHSISRPLLDDLIVRPMELVESNVLETILLQDVPSFTDGTIAPRMLDCNGSDPSSLMDTIMFGNDCKSQMGRM
jgi:hypothetical protein